MRTFMSHVPTCDPGTLSAITAHTQQFIAAVLPEMEPQARVAIARQATQGLPTDEVASIKKHSTRLMRSGNNHRVHDNYAQKSRGEKPGNSIVSYMKRITQSTRQTKGDPPKIVADELAKTSKAYEEQYPITKEEQRERSVRDMTEQAAEAPETPEAARPGRADRLPSRDAVPNQTVLQQEPISKAQRHRPTTSPTIIGPNRLPKPPHDLPLDLRPSVDQRMRRRDTLYSGNVHVSGSHDSPPGSPAAAYARPQLWAPTDGLSNAAIQLASPDAMLQGHWSLAQVAVDRNDNKRLCIRVRHYDSASHVVATVRMRRAFSSVVSQEAPDSSFEFEAIIPRSIDPQRERRRFQKLLEDFERQTADTSNGSTDLMGKSLDKVTGGSHMTPDGKPLAGCGNQKAHLTRVWA
ncbi:hypothetical protein LY76DRAFT_630664 [Colletotrichum caudatum]|nr:hypothetical protein LY76DRAFT_630664 [Colletotrichum caudatum]